MGVFQESNYGDCEVIKSFTLEGRAAKGSGGDTMKTGGQLSAIEEPMVKHGKKKTN